MNAGLIRIKNGIRLIEAGLQPRIRTISYRGQICRFVQSIWWDNTRGDIVAQELDGYFAALDRHGWVPQHILDVGAETGLFSTVAGLVFHPRSLWAIEPSRRNRILLKRNLWLNQVPVAGINHDALWNERAELAFRSNGAISSIRGVGGLAETLPFIERVQAVTLDEAMRGWNNPAVDLIKMDIEGAEIEALDGARDTLGRGGRRPPVLIQAYHLRDGRRTLESCVERLKEFGYGYEEESAGLLVGWPQ